MLVLAMNSQSAILSAPAGMNRAALLLVFAAGLLAAGATAANGEECLDCHGDAVPASPFAASAHAEFGCAGCHTDIEGFPHPSKAAPPDCATCHDQVVAAYRQSIHGQARGSGTLEAPNCFSCHGDVHALVPHTDSASPVHPSRLPETCGSCHANPELVAKFNIPFARPLAAYRASVHARAVAQGRDGATCSDCHGSHAIFAAADPRSPVYHSRVPETCGTCHNQIAAAYKNSIHGIAVAHGARQAPVCTDCHGEHRILSPKEPGSPVFSTNIPLLTCGRCHGDIRLTERYGLPLDKVPAYEDSYH
ncbi:MAG: hypothetical protein ACE5HL_09310, partial [Terriglobia bacterium]